MIQINVIGATFKRFIHNNDKSNILYRWNNVPSYKSSYITRQFIFYKLAPLSHKGRNLIPEKFTEFCRDQSMAMLFCYFNQIQYFKEYLASYEGKCIILIGPVNDSIFLLSHLKITWSTRNVLKRTKYYFKVDGKRHCDPEPYYLHTSADDELRRQWDLVAYHDIKGEGEDLIAIYIRRRFEWPKSECTYSYHFVL